MPDLSPDGVEVVELVRGRAFIVVRTWPERVVVLDESGRLVRGRERLTAIARHVRAVHQVEGVLGAAQLERRQEDAVRGATLLRRLDEALAAIRLGPEAATLRADLELFGGRLVALLDERSRSLPATERTLRRTVTLLNDAARADRSVVRGARTLARALAGRPAEDRASPAATLRRWAVERLGAPDLPFFHPEFDDRDRGRFVDEFVLRARS